MTAGPGHPGAPAGVAPVESPAERAGKRILFGAVVAAVLATDIATKLMVQRTLQLYEQRDVLGTVVRLTYIHNPGAAFGIHLGAYSRWIFLLLSLVVLGALLGMLAFTPARDRIRIAAIALICGGAAGNLIDRIKSARGVVDFLDVGFGTMRWPVFNVADMALTVGAIVLALSLWREERRVVGGTGG